MTTKNLVLVGFMGTGKTHVGRIIADRLERKFVDIDDQIVVSTSMTVNDIFKTYGEDFFRDLESKEIEKFSNKTDLVISTGGGSLQRAANVDMLKLNGVLVWLVASPEEIVRRTSDDRHRPLLNVTDRIGTIRDLLSRRTPTYRVSDIVVSTEKRSPESAAEEVIDKYRRFIGQWNR